MMYIYVNTFNKVTSKALLNIQYIFCNASEITIYLLIYNSTNIFHIFINKLMSDNYDYFYKPIKGRRCEGPPLISLKQQMLILHFEFILFQTC